MPYVFIVLGVLLIITVIKCVRIVPQGYSWVTEFLGKYYHTWNPGLHLKIPFLERISNKVTMKERTFDFDPQGVITKDNVTIRVDSVVFLQVMDPVKYTYGIEKPEYAIDNLTSTTLRSIIGDMEFDDVLSARETINSKMTESIDRATDPWGIRVTRVELKDITPPADIQDAMAKQMKSERERRQTILEAEAHQEAVVKRAEGDKRAKVMAAEAERDARIALAVGDAESIKRRYEAEAEGITRLNQSGITQAVLQLRGIESLKEIANGNSTKIFFPTDITNAVATLGIMGEAFDLNHTMEPSVKEKLARPELDDPCLDHERSKETVEAAMHNAVVQNNLQNRGTANVPTPPPPVKPTLLTDESTKVTERIAQQSANQQNAFRQN